MRQLKSQTDRFSLTLGVTPGYFHQNANASDSLAASLAAVWQEVMEQVAAETDIYVPAIVTSSLAVYSQQHGYPEGGEQVVHFSGTRNPEYCKESDAWKDAVVAIATEMKTRLKQVTSQIDFDEVEMVYLTDK